MIAINTSEMVRAFDALGSLPAVRKRLNELAEDADTSSTDLAEIIALDPGLTVRLVAEANKKAEAHDVPTAAGILEYQEILKIVRSSIHSYRSVHVTYPLMEFTDFWSNGVCCALAASSIARRSNANVELMHTIGLLHNVGGAILYLLRPSEVTRIVKRHSGRDHAELCETGPLRFDIYQAELTSRLLSLFGIPDRISHVILHCHQPHRALDYTKEACILHMAQAIAQEMRPAWKGGPVREAQHGLHPCCKSFIDNPALMIDQIKREVEMAFDYAYEIIQPSIF